MTHGNHTAFPKSDETTNGMTKREYFAAMAMQGIMSHGYSDIKISIAAHEAVLAADALIKALNENPANE